MPAQQIYPAMIALVALVALTLPSHLMAQCDVCQTEVRAACHSETTYSICLDGVPTKDVIDCPNGFHCTGGKYICYPLGTGVTNCITTVTSTAAPTTTTRAPRDPDTLCKETQRNTQITNEMDPTCATYVQCTLKDGEWKGVAMVCQTGWFNGDYCDSDKPDFCT